MSVPLWVYRGLMLLWALWLAYALLQWLKWGWNGFTTNGYWRAWEKKAKVPHTASSSSSTPPSKEEIPHDPMPPKTPPQ